VNVNAEEGAAMKKGAGSKDSEVRQDAARVSTNSSQPGGLQGRRDWSGRLYDTTRGLRIAATLTSQGAHAPDRSNTF
jgi:hypothetical protein